ncbi:hypothetical protein F52700_4706 [Fusarium sp. NRRL 52700]|nr:hypothetical protein F52700_4706 [Fusarium sp. NRRL 52700]
MSEQHSEDPPDSEKHLFLVFLRKDLGDISAVEFIRHSIQCSGFSPWADATGDLKSTIIEATPKQAKDIASHPDIVRMTPVEATILEDDTEPDDDSTRTVYVVRPTNRKDKDQCSVIHASLKDIFQDKLQPQELGPHGVSHWKVDATSDQVPLAASIQGVRSVIRLDQYLLKKSETSAMKKRRIIKPIGIDNQERCKATGTALRNIFGANLVPKVLQDVSKAAGTNKTSSSDRDGLLYVVFIRLSPDANTNVDLIPNALMSDDRSSWVKVDEQITKRATRHEISAIRRRPDFERFVRIEASTYEATIIQQQEYLDRTSIETQIIVSQAEILDSVKSVQPNLHDLDRRYVAGAYVIRSIDRGNQEQCAETSAFLARLLGEHNYKSTFTYGDGNFQKWSADLSNKQVAQVKALDGVKGVGPIHKGRRCCLDIESTTNDLESQALQEILYQTQSGAPTELVAVNQPRYVLAPTHPFGHSFLWPPTGKLSEFSKGGPHVTLHAVGDPIECLPRDSKDPFEQTGTACDYKAASKVAGEIANLLSYENVPFDTSDRNLVKNLKAYLQSAAASWERYPGIRVL